MCLPDRKTAHSLSKAELTSRALDGLPSRANWSVLCCKGAAAKEIMGDKVGKRKRCGDKAAAKLPAGAS